LNSDKRKGVRRYVSYKSWISKGTDEKNGWMCT
jgi:hypothetical protein